MKTSAKVVIRPNQIGKDGTAPLVLRIYINKGKLEIGLGTRIHPEDWDSVKSRAKARTTQARDINLLVQRTLSIANEIFIRYRLNGQELTYERFQHEWKDPNSRIDFIRFMEGEVQHRWRREQITDSTRTADMVCVKKLERYRQVWLKSQNLDSARPLCFTDIDGRWMEEFDGWHLQELKRERGSKLVDKGLAPRWNAIKKIKTYLRRGEKAMGAAIQASALDFHCQRPAPKQCALTQPELVKLIQHLEAPDTDPQHKAVLTWFVFSCFTGMRFSDIRALKWTEIDGDRVTFAPIKTRYRKVAPITVPLADRAKRLLPEPARGKVWGVKTNQCVNRTLKEIAFTLGLPSNLSFKYSRDTFATTFLERGGTVEVLQQLLGHSKIQETMKYVSITEQRKREQMTLMDGF